MKKFYTLLVAAGVSAFACSAAQPMAKGSEIYRAFELNTVENATLGKVMPVDYTAVKGMHKAPAAAAAAAPANLENEMLVMNYSAGDDRGMQDVENVLTFKLRETDPASGMQLYTMTGFFAELFNEEVVTVHSFDVYYLPSEGRMVLDGSKPVLSAEGQDFSIWAQVGQSYWSNLNIEFKYNNGGFEWVNPTYGQDETGTEQEFNVELYFLGRAENQQLSYVIMFENLSMTVADGVCASVIDYKGELLNTESPVYTTVSGTTLNVNNFAGMPTTEAVPFAVDATAKTITARNFQVELFNGNPVWMAEENENQYPVKDGNDYVLVGKYEVKDGKTVVTFPRWNAFSIYDGEADYPIYYSRTSVMTLNFNLDAQVGVGNIAVDADTNAPVEYFNLQGVRVANPENGLYIRRQGKNVTKVIL